MKEVIQEIHKIEDREMRALVRYEKVVAWHKSGGFQRASAAYHAQIAEAARVKAVAELRINQIEILQTAVSRFDAKGVRNAQIAEVAARYRASAAERQAIQEAIDKVLALEEVVPADDIDDILSQVSNALGIELPTDADRADICQRGHKSMEDFKRELGPSVWDQRMAKHENDRFHELRKKDRFAKLIAVYSTSVTSFAHIKADTSDENMWVEFFDDMLAKRDRLYGAITTLRDQTTEPPFPLHRLKHAQTIAPAPWTEKFSRIELWALANFDRWDNEVTLWIDRNRDKPEWADDVLDETTLDASWKAVTDQFDAGRTLEQLGWSPPSDEPPDPPHGVTSIAEVIRRAAA